MDTLINPKSVPALKGILFISLVASLTGSVVSFFQKQPELQFLFLSLSLLLFLSLWLYRKRLLFASIIVSLFAGLCSVTIFSIIGKGLHDPIMVFFPAFLIFSCFIFRDDVLIIITFVLLLLFNSAGFLQWNSFPPEFSEESFNGMEFIFYNAAFIAFAIVGKLLYYTISTKTDDEPLVEEQSAETKKSKSITVAIVEDNRDVLSLLQDEFEHNGYNTVAVDSAEALRDWIEANGTNIQLVITDFYLNMSDGRMVIEIVRKMIPHIPIILISGYPLEELGMNIEYYNDVEFIKKPFVPREIFAQAEKMLYKK
jgi:CheY-like chemotaxis protein